jgi:hypothetical protein
LYIFIIIIILNVQVFNLNALNQNISDRSIGSPLLILAPDGDGGSIWILDAIASWSLWLAALINDIDWSLFAISDLAICDVDESVLTDEERCLSLLDLIESKLNWIELLVGSSLIGCETFSDDAVDIVKDFSLCNILDWFVSFRLDEMNKFAFDFVGDNGELTIWDGDWEVCEKNNGIVVFLTKDALTPVWALSTGCAICDHVWDIMDARPI